MHKYHETTRSSVTQPMGPVPVPEIDYKAVSNKQLPITVDNCNPNKHP